MSSMKSGLSEDVLEAFSNSHEVINEKYFNKIDEFTAQMFFVIEKAKHRGFYHRMYDRKKILLYIPWLFPEKYRCKLARSRIISAIQEISCFCANVYYLDDEGIPYIFQIPLTEKSCIDKSINVVIIRFETPSNGLWIQKYTTSYGIPAETSNFMVTHVPKNTYRCPKTKLSYPPCNTCSTVEVKTKRCGRCELVSYCSKECQKKDWKAHKATCKKINIK